MKVALFFTLIIKSTISKNVRICMNHKFEIPYKNICDTEYSLSS